MIGANADTIDKAEDRDRFDKAMRKIGLECPRATIVHSMAEAWEASEDIGFPCIIRPSFTMGGSGGGIAYNKEDRKSTRLNSSHVRISYAVFCLKKKTKI